MSNWKCPFCGGNNLSTERSCPGCGCRQQDAPEPKRDSFSFSAPVTFREMDGMSLNPRPLIPPKPEPDGVWIGGGPRSLHWWPDGVVFGILIGLITISGVGFLLGLLGLG